MTGGNLFWPAGGSLNQMSLATAQWKESVVEGLFKSKHFILGCEKLIVAVDHKPLLGILNEKSLADIDNPRLLGLKEKTLWFSFKVVHVPGREHCGPDYISRLGDHKMKTKEARVNCI